MNATRQKQQRHGFTPYHGETPSVKAARNGVGIPKGSLPRPRPLVPFDESSNRINRGAGFTLLELLMVVIVIAILASIALPQYLKATEKARATEALQLLGAIRNSEARYKAQSASNVYTANEPDLDMFDAANPIATKYWGTVDAAGLILTVNSASLTRPTGVYATATLGITHLTGAICGSFAAFVLDPAALPCP